MRKVAIVTGGSRGIGRAIACEFVTQSYSVMTGYRTAPTPLVEGVVAVQADVSDYAQAESLVERNGGYYV